MLVDLLLAGCWILAIVRGLQKGLIIAVFSLFGFILGIAAALALSARVAQKISASGEISSKWLPAISFILVFFVVAFLVSLLARMMNRVVDFALQGWVNRIAGAIVYVVLVSVIMSVLMFYLTSLHIITENAVSGSVFYPVIKPIAPVITDHLGEFVPMFRNLFSDLRNFFESAGNNLY